MKAKYIFRGLLAVAALSLSSCSDFFDQDSDHIIYTDNATLNNPSDTLYSVTGIMTKMQAIADRTILLGEARGDLVDVTDATSSDLRDVANFNIGDDNAYNNPRDYYAIINNCNYYIARADTALKNSSKESIFMKEYAAVKAYRAWTYLQLAINYGKIPFVTEPILTKEEAEKTYEKKDITDVCNWLINDIAPLANEYTPGYGTIGTVDSRLLYFPIYLLLGDLNLWAGNYKASALAYYNYLCNANGANSITPTFIRRVYWMDATTWNSYNDSWSGFFSNETYFANREQITMIAGDSIKSQGHYSQLRNIFNSTSDNDYKVSLTPSQSLINLSAAQTYCQLSSSNGTLDTIYAPKGISNYMTGDLRLRRSWNLMNNVTATFSNGTTKKIDFQTINKYSTRNVHIYRRQMVYLRLAEALNCAGYPRFAYDILSRGINDDVIATDVLPYYTADAAYLSQFKFPFTSNSGYIPLNPVASSSYANMIGIHDHGSGWSAYNKYYTLPDNAALDSVSRIAYQQKGVEKMILDEGALECAFEGTRYYDLLRAALRDNDNSLIANYIYARKGTGNEAQVKATVTKDLTNKNNWFLSWKGQIGY
jgi:hypothetical protein